MIENNFAYCGICGNQVNLTNLPSLFPSCSVCYCEFLFKKDISCSCCYSPMILSSFDNKNISICSNKKCVTFSVKRVIRNEIWLLYKDKVIETFISEQPDILIPSSMNEDYITRIKVDILRQFMPEYNIKLISDYNQLYWSE